VCVLVCVGVCVLTYQGAHVLEELILNMRGEHTSQVGDVYMK